MIKRASTAYSYGYNYYGYVTPRKSKTESGRMRRERLFRLRIRQFFVCHQPQSIQVTESLFYALQTARRYACFIHDLRKPANEHMPCAFRSSHPARVSSPLRAAYLMTAAFYHASAVSLEDQRNLNPLAVIA